MSNISTKRVLVTGGAGFLGKALCQFIARHHPAAVIVPRSKQYDLREAAAIRRLFQDARPDVVVHLAAAVGGIGANRDNPGRYFYDNAIMGIQLIEEARQWGVDKFVLVGTVCSYPKVTDIPFREDDLWNGFPEETNAPYGLAKKMLLVQAQAYRQQYGMNVITLLPVNLYGPGDNFDLQTSHVIPALIRKAIEARAAGQRHIEVWGSGEVSREFIFVEDAAEAIVKATEHYDKPSPVNVGTGEEIKIKNLARLICDLCGYNGALRWDASKPDGQPRRCLDVTRAREEFGFQARTPLRDGLVKTIEWYKRRGSVVPRPMVA